ncbi:protein SON-like isoform X1 [Argonauta hians]
MISFDKAPQTCHSVMQAYSSNPSSSTSSSSSSSTSSFPSLTMYGTTPYAAALANEVNSRLQYKSILASKPTAPHPKTSLLEKPPDLYATFRQQPTILYPTVPHSSVADNSSRVAPVVSHHQPASLTHHTTNNNNNNHLLNVYSNNGVSQPFYNQNSHHQQHQQQQIENRVNIACAARPSDALKEPSYENVSHIPSLLKPHKKITELSDEDLSSRFPTSPLISSKMKPSSLTLYSSICNSSSSSSSSAASSVESRRRRRSRSPSPSYSRAKSPSSYSRSRSSSRRKSSRRSRSKSPYSKGRGHSDKSRYSSSRLPENDKSSSSSSSSKRSRSREKDYHRETTSQSDKYRVSSRHRPYTPDTNHSSSSSSITTTTTATTNSSSSSATEKSVTSKEDRLSIDKVKLHNIAVEKLIKSGSAAKEDIASLRAGGKTVQELINYCKQISQKEQESGSDNPLYDSNAAEEEVEPVNHPFKRPENNNSIIVQAARSAILNMKNNKPHPLLSPQEMVKDSPLRLQFPVSSGSQHRAKELQTSSGGQLGFHNNCSSQSLYGGRNGKPGLDMYNANCNSDQVFPPESTLQDDVNITQIMTERMNAVKKLQKNPHDTQALGTMYRAQKELNRWAQSKQLPGLFTGSTGAKVMTLEELNGPDKKLQAWAKKQQILNAAPVKGGIGMHLLQKMGWREGEGLGKNSKGPTEPIIVNVKIDRKGLTSHGEDPKKSQAVELAKHISGKHPVSALVELSNKLKWGAPIFQQIEERGPDHKKTFKYKVCVNNITYQPTTSSNSKKTGRAKAAIVCLHNLGLLPKEFTV